MIKPILLRQLQKQGETILMTGDGLNDAGALMQSDVALTIADKVYHFAPASDAVLEAGKFQQLARFIRFTKTSLKYCKNKFYYLFLLQHHRNWICHNRKPLSYCSSHFNANQFGFCSCICNLCNKVIW